MIKTTPTTRSGCWIVLALGGERGEVDVNRIGQNIGEDSWQRQRLRRADRRIAVTPACSCWSDVDRA